MTSFDKKFCTLCYDDDGTSTEAVTWCTDCEVFLCTDCGKHHKRLKTSKDHKTMSTKDYHKLPKFIKEISNQCKDHKKKFELYCSSHGCPCCVTCITDEHQKCQELKPLSDILENVKSSASVQLFEKDLKNVKENFEEIIKYLNSRIETSTIQKQKAAEQIGSMRKSIDDFFNKLEQEILKDLESKQSKLKSKMNTLLQQLNTQANQITQVPSEFSQMTQYATELQTYVGLREIEKTTSQAAQYIEDLKSGGKLDENNLEITVSCELQSILKDIKSFGDININTSPSSLQVKTGRKDQAQNLVQAIPGIEEIKPTFLRQLTIAEDRKPIVIRACKILPTGEYLILDSQSIISHLLLFSNDGMFVREIVAINGCAVDSCLVRNNKVAVTIGLEKQTALVDVEKNKIIKTITLSHNCDSAASDGEMLVISSTEKSTIVNLNNESHTILEGVVADCLALFKGNIYGATIDDKIFCVDCTGKFLWTFKHHDIDNSGRLTLDKYGFVYIASLENNSIVVVSPDGKSCKTILSEADGIKDPLAIDINRETGMMIVSSIISDDSEHDTAYVYKI
ncbi:E3 ubiquitin-protein ligase TRIM33-like [Mytilus edulis]|uniref:E3 ubiquitin-protein ligase TRIM33-like n=1 Tax=Mytilus edulis TaxID=6550 RepID=UPI0039F14658